MSTRCRRVPARHSTSPRSTRHQTVSPTATSDRPCIPPRCRCAGTEGYAEGSATQRRRRSDTAEPGPFLISAWGSPDLPSSYSQSCVCRKKGTERNFASVSSQVQFTSLIGGNCPQHAEENGRTLARAIRFGLKKRIPRNSNRSESTELLRSVLQRSVRVTNLLK